MSEYREADYPCVGVCMDDPETGYCMGCGRPPWPVTHSRQGNAGLPAALPDDAQEEDVAEATPV